MKVNCTQMSLELDSFNSKATANIINEVINCKSVEP